jgi:hypothetical protein
MMQEQVCIPEDALFEQLSPAVPLVSATTSVLGIMQLVPILILAPIM